MVPIDEIKFTFQTQARALLSEKSNSWYAYVRILLNGQPYAEFNGEGIAEFDTPVWAQGIADMVLKAEREAAKRMIQEAADNLKNTFGDGS